MIRNFVYRVVVFALLMVTFVPAGAQSFNIVNSSRSKLELSLNIDEFRLQDESRDGLSGQAIVLNGIFLPNEAGKPNLPVCSRYIAIPRGAQVSVNVKNQVTETLNEIELMPAPELPLDNDNSPMRYIRDEAVYSTDAFFPAEPIYTSESLKIRDVDVVLLSVTPFQYNPVTKELVVTRKLELELDFEGGDGTFGGDTRYRSDAWDHIIRDMVINETMLPEANYRQFIREAVARGDEGCEYLIITPDNEQFVQIADSIKLFRNQQGILTDVVTVSECGGNNCVAIRNYIINAYNNWDIPLSAVLILGDHSSDSTRGVVSYTMNNHPGGDGYNPYISDHRYSCVDNDHLPDVVVGRITGRDYEELFHMVNKDLQYERHPSTNPRFYNKPITAMGFQLERWFQLCSEIINGFFEYELEKEPVRVNAIYQGTPGSQWSTAEYTNSVVNYFGPGGMGYIPQHMSHLTDWSGSANMINDNINKGSFILQHRDHGSEELWGEPSYNIGYINRLANPDLTYVMSCNCLTGRFNYSGQNGCFAEAFHRHQYGALGLIAATQVSYSFLNDVYVWGMYDNMWSDFMPLYGTDHPAGFIRPAFANVSGKYYLQQSNWISWGDGREITYYLFHHHGDVYMNLYSEMPQELEVTMLPVIVEGSVQYQITANENATICLTHNGEIIGLDLATGQPQILSITPQEVGNEVVLTVTKQNYYRYSRKIAVIPTTGPYLIFSGCEINDADQNGQLDFNESATLDVAIHNVGFDHIQNVNVELTTDSPYVDIISSTATYDALSPDEIVNKTGAFSIHVIDGVPDQTKIWFHLTMSDGNITFTDEFSLIVNAPMFEVTNRVIRDMDDNIIDRLYRSEKAKLTYTVKNSGHSVSDAVRSILLLEAPVFDYDNYMVDVDNIGANDSVDVTFVLRVLDDAPAGAIIGDYVKVVSNGYQIEYNSEVPLGNSTEDFETEALNPLFEWANNSNYPWVRDSIDPYEGDYCFTATSISSSKKSRLALGVEAEISDVFSFYYKGSVNSDDVFTLQINTDHFTLDGGPEWQLFEHQIPSGKNLIIFTFTRKSNAPEGSASIDLIKLPPMHVEIYDVDENYDENNQVTVYPNPGADQLNVITSGDNIKKIQIFDFQGRMILEKELNGISTTINTENWSSGIYFWKAGSTTGKWIKSR